MILLQKAGLQAWISVRLKFVIVDSLTFNSDSVSSDFLYFAIFYLAVMQPVQKETAK